MPQPPEGEQTNVDAHSVGDVAASVLIDAGAVLASSLDPSTTMGQVASLTLPRLADLCVIDLRDEDGSIRDVAVACVHAELAQELEELRVEHPLDPAGGHPVAQVLRSGQPVLLPEMTSTLLSSFAQGSKHAKFMIDHGYRSAVVAPLNARERTLGALSVLRLGGGTPYGQEDLRLVCELARRAALAIDNARLYSEVRSVERRLEAILVNLAEAITVVDEHGQTVFANQAAADLLCVSSPEQLTSSRPGSIMPRFAVLDEQGRRLDLEHMPGRQLFAGETPGPLLVRNIVLATGEERWLIVSSSPIADPESGRILYVVNVFENITEVKRVQLAESFMAQASRVLASSLDYAETLQRIARLAVPQIADWCAVELVNEKDEIERVAVHHPDPAKLELAERLDRDYRPSLDEPAGVPEVIRTGEARIYTDIPADALAQYARDNQHLELLSAIGATSVIIVPMIGATGPIGAITLVSAESMRRLSPGDLALAETSRSPCRHRRGKRSPVHRALTYRTDSPAGAAAGVAARHPWSRCPRALLRRRRAQRSRRRLLRRLRLRDRSLDAGDRRRLRQGPPRRRSDRARTPYVARRRDEWSIVCRDAPDTAPRAAPPAPRGRPLHRVPRRCAPHEQQRRGWRSHSPGIPHRC